MSQVPVKYVDPDCLFQTKGLNTTVVPVVPLAALREVVEGLKLMRRPIAECPPELYQQWLDSNGEETFWGWLAQRLLASLGEIKKQDSRSSNEGRTLSTAELPGMTLQETIDAQRKA